MNVLLWIVAALLAGGFGAGGLIKLLRPKDRLIRAGMRWAEDFSPGCIKADRPGRNVRRGRPHTAGIELAAFVAVGRYGPTAIIA
jgi:hypothetical protein